jgi:hypothetical protein
MDARSRVQRDARCLVRDKHAQWHAFLSRNRLDVGGLDLKQIIPQIRLFLIPPLIAAANGQSFEESWAAGVPWEATT